MSLLVEDGTGLIDAESYVSVAFADAYHVARGNEKTWKAKDKSIKEIALRKATEYIDIRFGARWKGEVEFPDTPQALAFPRLCIPGFSGVPVCLERATCEFALLSLTTELAPNPEIDSTGRPIAFKSEKVGPIQEKTGFFDQSSTYPKFPLFDAMLRPLLRSVGGVMR